MSDLEILKEIFNTNPDLPDWEEEKPPLKEISFEKAWSPKSSITIKNNQIIGLGFGGFKIKKVPVGISRLKNLRSLVFAGNPIESISGELFQLDNLVQLAFAACKLKHIPPEIAKLKNLEEVEFGGNEIISIPSEISQLSNLRELGLSGNQLNSLPPEIIKLNNLKTLVSMVR